MLLGPHTCSRLYLPPAKCNCGREDAASIRPEKYDLLHEERIYGCNILFKCKGMRNGEGFLNPDFVSSFGREAAKSARRVRRNEVCQTQTVSVSAESSHFMAFRG